MRCQEYTCEARTTAAVDIASGARSRPVASRELPAGRGSAGPVGEGPRSAGGCRHVPKPS